MRYLVSESFYFLIAGPNNQFIKVIYQATQVDHLGLKHLPPGEGQQSAG